MKKNKKVIFITGIVLVLLLVIYSNSNNYEQLTQHEKIEDFNYLYNKLKNNYPYYGILKRVHNYDWLLHKEAFETKIKETKNDVEYYKTLSQIVSKINNNHTNLISPSFYGYMKETYNNLPKDYKESYKPWTEILNNKKSEIIYHYLEDRIPIDNNKMWEKSYNEGYNNLETKIIEKNKISYVKIKSFILQHKDKDRNQLINFWNKIKDYPYLIIDIRGNSGGAELYWEENIVSQLISKDIKYINHSLYRGGKYSIPFIESKVDKLPIHTLDHNLLHKNEVMKSFKYYSQDIKMIESVNSTGFNGKIYVLIDSINYSSAESFCMFIKKTKWATLVGESTAGDGGGFDPILVRLPNSGLIIRFPVALVLNTDGGANEEFHTVPDIKSSKPLKEVMKIIKKEIK